MSPHPHYRGALCRMALDGVRRRPSATTVVARVSPASIATLERSRASSWVPTAPYDELVHALLDEEGLDGIRDFFALQATEWSESKLIRPLFEAAQRIFGLTPAGHIKWFGRGWQLTTRGMGTLTTAVSAEHATLECRELPPSHRIPRMVAAMEGSLRGILAFHGAEGKVESDDADLPSGNVSYHVRWNPALTGERLD